MTTETAGDMKIKADIWHHCYDGSWKGLITDESWRPVAGTEGLYEVSDYGRVRSNHRVGRPTHGGFLSQTPNAKGYLRVRLWTVNLRKSVVVHRLVLEAFVGPQPSPVHECNHKNGNKQDNHVGNLEWATPKENNEHAVATGLWHPNLGEAHGRAKLTEKDVIEIRKLQGHEGAASIGRRYGVTSENIRGIWSRRLWKHVA